MSATREKSDKPIPEAPFAPGVIPNSGRVAAVQGPVVDVRFPEDEEAPAVYDCILTKTFNGQKSDPADSRTFRPWVGALCFVQ